jgi:hypothetical protein
MQSQLEAGTTLNYEATVAHYPSNEGWALKYRLVPQFATGAPIDINASAAPSGKGYLVQVAAGVTSAWAPGKYSYSAWVTNGGGEVYPAQSGYIEILPDPRTATAGTDLRSQARKALDDARAAFAAWSPVQRRYKIADREREFNSPADILVVIRYWEQQVAVEDRLAGRAEPISRRIYTRI